MKKILIFLLTVLILLAGCSKTAKHTKVQIEMQDGGKMVLELYPEYAPKTVDNFVKLVKSGYYDGTKFHRIIKGFMIQGGQGNSETKTIKGEFSSNGFKKNTLKHTKGIISMARTSIPDTATSQFFICDGTAAHLDGNYAAFGKLIDGIDVLDKIADTPVQLSSSGEMSQPKQDVIIKKITVLE